MGGTAGAQLLMMLGAPLLTRLYTPEDFGLLAVYAALVAFYSIVSSLRYELAIPLQETDREAVNVLALCLFTVTVTTSIAATLVWVAGDELVSALGAPGLKVYLWLLPIGVFLSGSFNVFQNWAIRTRKFSDIAQTNIVQAGSTVVFQGVGSVFGGMFLLFGQAAGQAAGLLRLGRPAIQKLSLGNLRVVEIWQAARRLHRFPVFSTWSALFNTAGTQMPPLLFSTMFTPSAAGFYALAHRVLSVPISVLGGAIGNVFLSRAWEAKQNNQLDGLVTRIHRILAEIAMPFSLFLVFLAPTAFALVFGEPWRKAGEFAAWLAPFLYLQFSTSPISMLHSVVGKQAQEMGFHTILLTVRALSIAVGAFYQDVLMAVALFSISSAACWLFLLIWILKLAGCPAFRTFLEINATAMFFGGLAVSPLLLAVHYEVSLGVLLISIGLAVSAVLARFYYLFRSFLNRTSDF